MTIQEIDAAWKKGKAFQCYSSGEGMTCLLAEGWHSVEVLDVSASRGWVKMKSGPVTIKIQGNAIETHLRISNPSACHQCGKDDLPLNRQSGLCVRCAIDNEVKDN